MLLEIRERHRCETLPLCRRGMQPGEEGDIRARRHVDVLAEDLANVAPSHVAHVVEELVVRRARSRRIVATGATFGAAARNPRRPSSPSRSLPSGGCTMRYRTRRARALEQCAERDRGSPRRVRVSEWSARDIADSQAGDKAPHDEQAPTDARARLAVHDHERRREAEAHLRGRPSGALDEVSPGDAFREGVPLGVGSAVRPRARARGEAGRVSAFTFRAPR